MRLCESISLAKLVKITNPTLYHLLIIVKIHPLLPLLHVSGVGVVDAVANVKNEEIKIKFTVII